MANKCLESYSSDLNNQHSKLVKEGMSDRGAAMKLALDEYNKFYEDLNSLETSLGIPLTAKP